MWGIKDENGNMYTNKEEISKDFFLVNMTDYEKSVVRALMTDDVLPIGYIAELSATYLNIPYLEKKVFKKFTRWRLSRFNLNTNEWERMTGTTSIPQGRDDIQMMPLNTDKLWLLYSRDKNKIYLGGINQSADYTLRLQLRNKAVENMEMVAPEWNDVKIPLSQMGIGERIEARNKIEFPTVEEFYQMKAFDPYSFVDCRNGCGNGLYLDEHRKQSVCPLCKDKRKKYLREKTRDYYSKRTLREYLNIPDSVNLPGRSMTETETYKKIMELRDKDFVCIESVNNLLIVYCTLLKLYVDRPYSSGHYDLRITPIYTPETALLNIKTDSVLVIGWHTQEELAVVDNIREQRKQMQQENNERIKDIMNKPKLHYKTLAFQY